MQLLEKKGYEPEINVLLQAKHVTESIYIHHFNDLIIWVVDAGITRTCGY